MVKMGAWWRCLDSEDVYSVYALRRCFDFVQHASTQYLYLSSFTPLG